MGSKLWICFWGGVINAKKVSVRLGLQNAEECLILIYMISKGILKKKYPNEIAQAYFVYLANKHRGGVNNSKGNTYENFYTVYKIAQEIKNHSKGKNTSITSQAYAFVDDLVIEYDRKYKNRRRTRVKKSFFQIKDVSDLSWTSNKVHPLYKDFEIQYSVLKSTNKSCKQYLVVSNKKLHQKLSLSIPKSIRNHTNVEHFETADSLSKLIVDNAVIRNTLASICALKNPTIDKLVTLGTIILGAWDASNKQRVRIADIIESCLDMNPNYIKGKEQTISEELTNRLKAIKGFTFTVLHGYLSWEYNKTDKGIMSCRIGSKEFVQFEDYVKEQKEGLSFDQIESNLI